MIDFYTWFTPNGRKVAIMLEETGLDYTVCPINIAKDDQFDPDFLKISPNNKIPAIVDHDNNDYPLFETGAILLYLAEKTGKFLNTKDRDAYWRTMEWLMWQMGGYGPILGQVHHFTKYNPDASDYARKRYEDEARRLYGVLNKRLEGRDFIVDEYSIADMACWPWAARHNWQEIDLNELPALKAWYVRIAERPATQRGYDQPKVTTPIPMP